MINETALLGMAGAATSAIITASGFVIRYAVLVGRHLQLFDDMQRDVDKHSAKLEMIDAKVERHLQWHADVTPGAQSQGDLT